MKKGLLFLSFALFMSVSAFAWKLVPLSPCGFDNTPVGHDYPKTEPPTVYIEDYTLSFEVDHPEYVLNIKDENNNVVYTTTVYSTQTQVVLPSTLSGDYQIELVMGYWLFTGWINL